MEGGCACGAIRYELTRMPFDAGWCHCRICQLVSGAPAMVFATVPFDHFRFLCGADKARRFQSSDTGHRLFCGECGTPLLMQLDDQPEGVDFSVATLDAPDAVAPGFHIFHASRIAWFETADSLPRHAGGRSDATAQADGEPIGGGRTDDPASAD